MFESGYVHMLSRLPVAVLLWAALAAPVAAQTLVDPLRPAASAVVSGTGDGASGAPVLSIIVLRDDRSYVVLDGTVRRIGDRFGGFRLSHIGPTQATLVGDDGQRLVVSLLPLASVKQSSDKKP